MEKWFKRIVFIFIFILVFYFAFQTGRLIMVDIRLRKTQQKLDEVHKQVEDIYEKYDIKNELKESEVVYEFRAN